MKFIGIKSRLSGAFPIGIKLALSKRGEMFFVRLGRKILNPWPFGPHERVIALAWQGFCRVSAFFTWELFVFGVSQSISTLT
ncbi:MAG TPA: hypothetical protein DEB15_16235 [Pusillimonas sp.]|nr:hypothetical protein [Pusillimonas sp.]